MATARSMFKIVLILLALSSARGHSLPALPGCLHGTMRQIAGLEGALAKVNFDPNSVIPYPISQYRPAESSSFQMNDKIRNQILSSTGICSCPGSSKPRTNGVWGTCNISNAGTNKQKLITAAHVLFENGNVRENRGKNQFCTFRSFADPGVPVTLNLEGGDNYIGTRKPLEDPDNDIVEVELQKPVPGAVGFDLPDREYVMNLKQGMKILLVSSPFFGSREKKDFGNTSGKEPWVQECPIGPPGSNGLPADCKRGEDIIGSGSFAFVQFKDGTLVPVGVVTTGLFKEGEPKKHGFSNNGVFIVKLPKSASNAK